MDTLDDLSASSSKTTIKTNISSKQGVTIRIKRKKPSISEDTEPTSPQKSSTPIFIDKTTVKPCVDTLEKNEELNMKRLELNQKKKECEEELYNYIFKFFNSNETLEDLLHSLFSLYKERKSKNISFKLTFREFIMLFPRDTSVSGYNFRRQHVFEQMCRLMLLFNYDNNYFGKNKEF